MKLQVFKDKLFEFLCENPNFCVYSGIEKNLGDLPDPGKNRRITRQGKIKMLKNTLADIDQTSFSNDEKIDLKLCELLLEEERLYYELEIDGVPMNMRMPKAARMISGPLFMFFINDPREDKYRLVNILSRLEKVPEFLISYKRNLIEPVERWVKMEVAEVEALPSFFANILNWAKEIEFKNIDRLEKAINKAQASLEDYKNFLKISSTTKNIILGEKQMQEVLDSRGIKLSFNELKEISANFLKKNMDDVETLRKRLCEKYELDEKTTSDDLKAYLDKKFAVKREGEGFDFILKRYELEREKILAFVKEHDLFPVMDDQDMHVMQTPDFMAPTIPAGAMMPPLPLRDGVKKSLVYLTLSEELLPEHTEISIPGMMIHEGIPGHHLQFAWAATNDSIVRKISSFNDLSEGWTTMLEDYMLDRGYAGDLADEIRFSTKRDIARIGARVAIDLYFMSGDKSFLDVGVECDLSSDDVFVNAGNLLQAVTGFVDARVEGELNWYSQERGYPLSYLTGNHLVWNLKEKFLKTHMFESEDEADREFHNRFLLAGNMPVSFLEEVLLN